MSNEGNIKASILLILLKCIVVVVLMETKVSQVGCFQITGRWICYSNFFDISFIVFFTRLLSKSLWTTPFRLNFQKSISRCSILRKIRMSNFVILNGKNLKNGSIFRVVFSEIKNADILDFSWIKYFGNDFSFLKKTTYMSLIVEITGRRTWQQNWKQPFDCKLVYILGKTVQDMFWTDSSGK